MKYLYKHKCDKCDFSFKMLHDKPLTCGIPFNTPDILRRHRQDTKNKHLWFSIEKIDEI